MKEGGVAKGGRRYCDLHCSRLATRCMLRRGCNDHDQRDSKGHIPCLVAGIRESEWSKRLLVSRWRWKKGKRTPYVYGRNARSRQQLLAGKEGMAVRKERPVPRVRAACEMQWEEDLKCFEAPASRSIRWCQASAEEMWILLVDQGGACCIIAAPLICLLSSEPPWANLSR